MQYKRLKLNIKQQRFVEEYLKDLNATQAAIRAGYSPHTAQEQSSRLLSNVIIQKAVESAKNRRSNRINITQDQVLAKLMQIEKEAGHDGQHTPRVQAVKLLGIHIGMFGEKLEVKGTLTLADISERARRFREAEKDREREPKDGQE